ncbi:hypothetical protein Daus18300_009408 [Diaporthe australafricana]|uniref:Uncharacterized protein n=1 Tax=Diaporthe australafricana TaxID=127596 RepID=A0ABR3WF44_9PEZI
MLTFCRTGQSLRTAPGCLLPSASASTWPPISSLSARSLPQRLEHQPLHQPLILGSRNKSTSQQGPSPAAAQTENVDTGHGSALSFDRFAEQAIREAATSPATAQIEPTPGAISQDIQPLTHNPSLLLLDLFERLVKRGLLPQVVAKPPPSASVDHETGWTVTISLPEWGIDVKGRGSSILYAEVAAVIQFDLVLSKPEYITKLRSSPQTPISCKNAPDVIQSYWQFALGSSGRISRRTTKLESGAYEARIFAGSTQIGGPATSAVKDSARGIKNLTLAHAITSGHPDLWRAGLQNPFQAKIVFDHARLEKLQHLITAATDYLRTRPGDLAKKEQHDAYHEVVGEASHQNNGDAQEGEPEAATHRDFPDLDSWLASLPFSPSTAKMLVVAASLRCLEPAILLAAVEKHAVYQDSAYRGEGRNPASLNVMEGDHLGLILLFQRLRDQSWASKNRKDGEGQEDPSNPSTGAQSEAREKMTPESNEILDDRSETQPLRLKHLTKFVERDTSKAVETPSKIEMTVARRFDHFDPDRIASVSDAAREIERAMITAGLVAYNEETSYVGAPDSKLQARAEPYGGSLSSNSFRRSMLRHLLVLGFSDNIAQIGYGSLIPGQPPQLHINSQNVYIDSPLKAHMPMKQLSKNLRGGPLMVVTGATENPQGGGLGARYCTPISTWQAVLLGKDLSLPASSETHVIGAAKFIVNNWLPVLVKSEVGGVTNEQARDTLLEAREALRRAIDKAMFDYIKYSWHSSDFYKLLRDLPNEDSFAAKEMRHAVSDAPRRTHPTKHWQKTKDQESGDTKS